MPITWIQAPYLHRTMGAQAVESEDVMSSKALSRVLDSLLTVCFLAAVLGIIVTGAAMLVPSSSISQDSLDPTPTAEVVELVTPASFVVVGSQTP